MQILDLRHKGEPYPLTECGLVLGNFDGVHRGHRALIAELKRLKAERRDAVPLGAFCFAEPPLAYFGKPVLQLTDNEKKMELLRREGLQFIILCDFAEVVDLSPEDFVSRILVKECGCKLAVCGYNYTFGKGAVGKADDLVRLLGAREGCAVSVVDAVTDGRRTVSSSVIRTMLLQGHPEDAARLLGHPYTLSGTVQGGKRVGRTLGFPTANLTFPARALVPLHGVYAVTLRLGRRQYCGIANVGTRPTFEDGEHVNCEVFLLGFNGDLYGKHVEISFLHFLREEKKFENADALRTQIDRDIASATQYF